MNKRLTVSHFFRYQVPAFAWALVIFILSSFSTIRLPKISIIAPDKAAHIGVFFILGFLIYRAFEPVDRNVRLSWRRFFLTFVLAAGYGVLDEVHQRFVPGRSYDYYDMLADSIGVLISLGLAFWITRRKMKRGGAA